MRLIGRDRSIWHFLLCALKRWRKVLLTAGLLSVSLLLFQNFTGTLKSTAALNYQTYGSCAIVGGVGRHITPVTIKTLAECSQSCNQLGQFSNRKCFFKASLFRSADQDFCVIRGGGDRLLMGPEPLSQGQCQAACGEFSQNTYRSCYFGEKVLLAPSMNSRCEIKGGQGMWLMTPVFGSRTDCQALCNQFSENTYRSCRYGSNFLKVPTAHLLCVIRGEDGAYLLPTRFLPVQECQSRCRSQMEKRGAACYWGQQKI